MVSPRKVSRRNDLQSLELATAVKVLHEMDLSFGAPSETREESIDTLETEHEFKVLPEGLTRGVRWRFAKGLGNARGLPPITPKLVPPAIIGYSYQGFLRLPELLF